MHFFHTNAKISGFDTDRLSFLGLYNGLNEPEVVLNKKSNQSIASGGSPIGSHHIKVNLKPNQEISYIFFIGIC